MNYQEEREPRLSWAISVAPLIVSIGVAALLWFLDNGVFVSATISGMLDGRQTLSPDYVVLRDAAIGDWPQQVLITAIGLAFSFLTYSIVGFTKANWKLMNRYREELKSNVFSFGADAVRLLEYKEYDGILINTTAGDAANSPRNVLLNNTTLQKILAAIDDKERLRALGFSCGKAFGAVVNSPKMTSRNDFRSLVFVWFKYDSNAGFGSFELAGDIQPGRPVQIVLRHSFLVAGQDFREPEKSLCEFMSGYIAGVLYTFPLHALLQAGLTREGIVVFHDPMSPECICSSRNDDSGCRFSVQMMPEKAGPIS
ncbi:MAG: hypothetical protein V4707_11940 [Pseudomonadota bacterium]